MHCCCLKPLLSAAHHTITGALTTLMCCPETATTATEFTSTTLGAPVLTTETSLLNSQNALFQRVVKPRTNPKLVSTKWSKSSLKPEPRSNWTSSIKCNNGNNNSAKCTNTTFESSENTSTMPTQLSPWTCTNKESALTKLHLNLKRNLPKAATSTKLTHSCSESNTSTAKSLLNSDNVLPPVKPRSLVSTTDCSKSPTE